MLACVGQARARGGPRPRAKPGGGHSLTGRGLEGLGGGTGGVELQGLRR